MNIGIFCLYYLKVLTHGFNVLSFMKCNHMYYIPIYVLVFSFIRKDFNYTQKGAHKYVRSSFWYSQFESKNVVPIPFLYLPDYHPCFPVYIDTSYRHISGQTAGLDEIDFYTPYIPAMKFPNLFVFYYLP